jgi:hypothetical protein
VRIQKPSRVLIRAHLGGTPKYGQTIVDLLEESGVRVVRRTRERQDNLNEHRKLLTGEIRVFGANDLRPLVTIEDAVKEMLAEGYCLHNIHILDLDDVVEETEETETNRGKRVVVFHYEYVADEPHEFIEVPEYGRELFTRPFIGCRLWVNLRDPLTGASVHCAELIGLQFKQHPRLHLKFNRSIWGFNDCTNYSVEETPE